MFYFPFHSPTNEYYNVDSISKYFSVCPRTHVCVCINHSPLEVLFPITGTLPVLSGPAIICGWAFNDCIVCVCFIQNQIRYRCYKRKSVGSHPVHL